MSTGTITLTQADHGRRMTLDEFEHADGGEGCAWELGRGIANMVDVGNPEHGDQIDAIREQLSEYRRRRPRLIRRVAGGAECKLIVGELESERHPDLAIYLSHRPSNVSGADVWRVWIPEIVIEVVSLSSVVRDYEEKPDEYLAIGVKEYWIVDARKGEMLVLRRARNRWKRIVVRPPELHTTPLLPEFKFDLAAIGDVDGDA